MPRLPWLPVLLLVVVTAPPLAAQSPVHSFTFGPWLARPQTICLVPLIEGATVTVNGGDSRRPTTPFTFDWGDGTRSDAWFGVTHTYPDTHRNYTISVVAHYGRETGRASASVHFVKPAWQVVRDLAIPRRVTVAAEALKLDTTMPGYGPPELQGFAESELAVPRALLEYILDVADAVELDLCNQDVDPVAGRNQVVLKAADFGGAFSLWFTRPMALGANPSYLSNLGGVSSLFHEMGHNLTLNSPARFRFGGKIDGPMNTILSETLAQIMQHATAYQILNHPTAYGLPPEVVAEVQSSALASLAVVTNAHDEYRAGGCRFCAVQNQTPGQPDPTVGTFMTVAWMFIRHADDRGDFRTPTKRLMALLQTFREDDRRRFQDRANEAFRATLMTSALSYAFDTDLRPEARELNFPVDDAIYGELLGRMQAAGQ